ncbi:serine/threonine-protein kinase [Nocardia carnea]|uniref:serine/threonine-protein kinase n=1 Tax=Nocardia carnea TaxID=37328 RepID=UPI0024584793|nr:serine/threonine-protein kinase [Nocardia carnea]
MAGQRLGPYRLERLLGQGGMGQVWLAHADPAGGRPGRKVALKLLPAELAADPTYRSRFEREAELAARLHDPHLVSIHAHGELDGRLFIEMEYVDGEDLSRILHRGPLPPERAVDIVTQTAAALDAAHRAGLVHRDVKPSNIVIRHDGVVYLIDFGIAHGAGSTALTASGLAVGTWAYMAPERFTGDTDARADIYSLGCVLFECLAGIRPFGDTDPARQMHDHLTTAPPSVRALVPGISDRLDAVIARALAKEPGARFASAGEFARAAESALALPGPPAGSGPAEHPGIHRYELDAGPASTRRYESPEWPATRRYETPAPAPTGVHPDPPDPHPSTRSYEPGVGPVGTRRYEAAAPPPGTRPYTGLAAHGTAGAGHPPTRAYTRLETGHVAGGPPHGGEMAHAGVRPGAPARPAPRSPAPPTRRTPRARPAARPRRRKSRLRRLMLWLIVLVVVPLVLIGGCMAALMKGAGSIEFFSGDDRPTASAGTAVRDGSFEFVVRNVESDVPTVGFDRAQGMFVVVSFTVRNIAPEPKTYTPLGQELHDTAGGKFGPDVTATAQRAATAAAPRTLQPGESLGTHLVYEVPAGSVPASMTFRDFPFSLGTSVALG